MMGWGVGNGWMAWAGWLWPMLMLIFWVGIVAAIVWLLGGLVRSARSGESPGAGLETLKRRYASGQITRAEYEEGRRLLQG